MRRLFSDPTHEVKPSQVIDDAFAHGAETRHAVNSDEFKARPVWAAYWFDFRDYTGE
jgi:hypothetical protein